MVETDISQRVAAVRGFNRFYTKQIGLLHEKLLRSPFSLSEARVIYELANREINVAAELGQELGLDAGYLSRILSSFRKRGLINKTPSDTDGRQSLLHLTEIGQGAFAKLNAASHSEIEAMLSDMPEEDQNRLIAAMHVIEKLLGAHPEQKVPYILRSHRPGDMGWVVHRHGVLYTQEYGWDEKFEGLVASIVAEFIQRYDPRKEHCWIAEKENENVGSVVLVKKSETVAKLRLLLVDPEARDLGIGSRLVNESLRFARQAGYTKITLWTNSILLAARHIYEKAGFHLVHEEPHHSFGHDLIGETWELDL